MPVKSFKRGAKYIKLTNKMEDDRNIWQQDRNFPF